MDVVEGFIESIIYKNNENGYTVIKVNSNNKAITAVGIIPFVKEGQHVKLTGVWKMHKQFGQQLSINKCEEIVPDTIEGIEKYLSSGVIRGIGPITAKKIIAHFGEQTLEILDSDI